MSPVICRFMVTYHGASYLAVTLKGVSSDVSQELKLNQELNLIQPCGSEVLVGLSKTSKRWSKEYSNVTGSRVSGL